ncbi:MAG: hypothetical protein H0W50_04240, partial [Parachlamydiaceae bacterium]|nr:hypothetical protein [Parachlamydiaceae bacterium]
LCSLKRKQWDRLFQNLDPHYGHQEIYLREKIGVYLFFDDISLVGTTTVKMLLISPHLKEHFFPYFARKLHFLIGKKLTKNDDAHLSEELNQMLKLYPSDFDLIRFSIYLGNKKASVDDLVSPYMTRLSEPLLAVLRLQIMVDLGKKITACREALLPDKLLKVSHEADWRFLAALLNPSLKFPKKDLPDVISKICSDSQNKHFIFSKIYQHTKRTIPPSFLKTWLSSTRFDWRPYYHYVRHHVEADNPNELKSKLFEMSRYIKHNEPEFVSFDQTKQYHCGNEDLFINLFNFF